MLLLLARIQRRFTSRYARFKMEKNKIEVLFQNENYLVVNKPYDLVINEESTGKRESLHLLLANQFPHLVCKAVKFLFYFPHRLDFATSGVLCLALNKKACALMCSKLQDKKCKKYYLAILRGKISEEFIEITHSIGYDPNEVDKSNRMCSPEYNPDCMSPKPALTRMLVLEYGLHNLKECTKVLIRIISGRRHQIRVHCLNIGHPIVGDYTYSSYKIDQGDEMDSPNRQMLHAYRFCVYDLPDFCEIKTNDPFDNSLEGWVTSIKVNHLDEKAFQKLDSPSDGQNSQMDTRPLK